jgi:hypothetical protein
MKLVFDSKDMIEFVRWYDGKKEKDCHRTFEEELSEWVKIKALQNSLPQLQADNKE